MEDFGGNNGNPVELSRRPMILEKFNIDYLDLESAKSKHTRFFFHKEWVGRNPRLSKENVRAAKASLYKFVCQPFMAIVIIRLIK